MTQISALALFSGGLDSILACRIIMAQSIQVKAIKYVSPFFDYELLSQRSEYKQEVMEKYGIDVDVIDISKEYIDLLHDPLHGFGRYFNPCIDCKILMLSKTKELLDEYSASFIFTGEVVGQRPMSQRRDTLRVIERDSICDEFLLRPLSAKLLDPSPVEEKGLVDREKLYALSGRGRQPQIDLAAEFGIDDYPNPAGGCILADPNLSVRIKKLYNGNFPLKPAAIATVDLRFLLFGRQFLLGGSHWFVLGRNQAENDKILEFKQSTDWLLKEQDRPGPTGILRQAGDLIMMSSELEELYQLAAGLVVRFGKKWNHDTEPPTVVIESEKSRITVKAEPLEDTVFKKWQM